MFYREFIITAAPCDRQQILNRIFLRVHAQFHQLPVILAFPQWAMGKPNPKEGFCPSVNRACMGSVLRVFSKDKEALELAVDTWGLQPLVAKQGMYVTPVCAAPATEKKVAFFRDRAQDTAAYRVNQGRADVDVAIDKLWDKAHELAYFPVKSSGGHQLSVYVGRMAGTSETEGKVSSYGLSNKSAPNFVPDF